MAQQITFSSSSEAMAGLKQLHQHHHSHHHHHHSQHMSFGGGCESGYASGYNLTRPLDSFDVTIADHSLSTAANTATTAAAAPPQSGEVQTTPRTTAAINYMSALQLSTPRIGVRSGRKGTPLKRQQSIFSRSAVYETTPKKCKTHENNENDESGPWVSLSGGGGGGGSGKVPFRARLDRSLSSQTMSPSVNGTVDKLDCTFDAISSSTPICQPFRAEFYEQQVVEEHPLKNFLNRSSGKGTRTKLIRKMQSFSPRKLMGMRAAKVPLREMDQNSVDFLSTGLFPVEEEESPIPKTNTGAVKKVLFSDTTTTISSTPVVNGAFSSGLRELMFGAIKSSGKDEPKVEEAQCLDLTTDQFDTSMLSTTGQETETAKEPQTETNSQLLDIYVSNLSHLDNGDSNSQPAEDADVSMNASMVADVERYFDELKRNATELLEEPKEPHFIPVTKKDSLTLYDMAQGDPSPMAPKDGQMEVAEAPEATEKANRPPMLLRKRKRPSTELIQAVLATPRKMRRSQSFHIGDLSRASSLTTDENLELPEATSDILCASHLISPNQRLGGARKRLKYDPVARSRFSPAKRSLGFENTVPRPIRRSVNGTQKLNIFKHLANCPPVRDYFFDFVDDRDLVAIYAVSRQCRAMIEEHPKLNARRIKYLEAAWRKKENNIELSYSAAALTHTSSLDEPVLRIQGERSLNRIPLHNRNVDTSSSISSSISEMMSPPVSPSKRKFYENQKLVQQNPGAFLVSCPRCRSSSLIERPEAMPQLSQSTSADTMDDDQSFSFRSLRSQSMCVGEFPSRQNDRSLVVPVRKQFSLPETSSVPCMAPEQRMAVCQSIQCGFRFCVHCSYAYEPGHKCIEIGTLSPLIKQARQPRVVACSKQSKRNLKRL